MNLAALFTASSDKSIQAVNLETGDVFFKQAKAHGDPINTILRLGPDSIATGDDGGTVKLWDLRQQKSIREYATQDDYVSQLAFNEEQNILLSARCAILLLLPCLLTAFCCSGDGTLAVYDIRLHKEVHKSDNQDDELLSIALVKGGKKVVVGTQEGVLNIWSWGLWGDISDRFPGHPNSIDAMTVVNSPDGEELLCTGSSDGFIRYAALWSTRRSSELIFLIVS